MLPIYLSSTRTPRKRPYTKWLLLAAAVGAVVLFAAGWWLFSPRPMPPKQREAQTSLTDLAWPAYAQAAVGIVGSSAVETHGMQTPVPTASTAKLITALVVLQAKPLALGESGPEITMTRNDIALLNAYTALGGSEIGKVFVGEKLTEYQMLEAMMLPSANNMADSLAIWAYGSLPAYRAAASAYLTNHGIYNTSVGVDASGLNPGTKSTAHDMVLIGELVMQNPVLAEIVGKERVDNFPLVGTIRNTNTLLGLSNIVGIKTGNSDEQGGAFVGAAHVVVDGKTQTIVTAVLGATSLGDALASSLSLINSAEVSLNPSAAGTINTGKTVAPTGSGGAPASGQGHVRPPLNAVHTSVSN